MQYPKTDNEGFIPRNYICNHNINKYPGLMENTLENNDIVPYLPCCYGVNYATKPGSIYRHYYYEEDLKDYSPKDQQALITTNKVCVKDIFGSLPKEMISLFDMYDYQKGYEYRRKGVNDTKNSFLECIMEGMYEETNIINIHKSKKKREKFLNETRNELTINLSNIATCRQEMYDFTTDQIIEYIRNPDVYLDPKLFTRSP